MTIDYEKAASHWTDQEPESVRMPKDELRAEISAFLYARKVGALATAGAGIALHPDRVFHHGRQHLHV